MTEDYYLTPLAATAAEFRDRGSKFLAHLQPVRDEAAALEVVEERRRAHPKCNHHCYAYRVGEGPDRYRANDDGEPSGTAGRPILGQIDKAGLSDVVIVVSRYFGGTKLGTSGLINAYREAARLALAEVDIGRRELVTPVTLHFGYGRMGDVLSALSSLGVEMADQEFGATCRVLLHPPRTRARALVRELKAAVAGVYLEEIDEEFEVEGLRIELAE